MHASVKFNMSFPAQRLSRTLCLEESESSSLDSSAMRVTTEAGSLADLSLPLSSEPSSGSGLRISTSEAATLGCLELKEGNTPSSVVEFQPVGTGVSDSAK